MALRIELNEDKPGSAKLSVRKWTASADVEVMVQRNQDNYYLSGINQWGPEKCWHSVPHLSVNNDILEGVVGTWLVDSLLSQVGNIRFLIQVRDRAIPSVMDGGAVKISPDVLGSNALDSSIRVRDFQGIDDNLKNVAEPPTQSEYITEELIDESAIKPDVIEDIPEQEVSEPVVSTTQTAKVRKGKGMFIIIALVVVLLLAGLAIYFISGSKEEAGATSNNNVVSGVCDISSVNEDELEFIKTCLQSKPSIDEIVTLIVTAKSANKCNIAQRLYANQSQQNAKIAVMYAKEYDEKFYQNNNCFSADKETAIYWYETALNGEPDNNEVSTRLEELR